MAKQLTNAYLSTLCLELSMLLQAGVTVKDGVFMMLDDENDKYGRKVLQALLDTLDNSAPLSEAMRGAGYFPPYMVNMVEVGEKTGRIAETLKALSLHYERQDRLATAVKNAVLYPVVLLAMMAVVILILVVQVLPIFNDVFARMGAQMSPFSEALMQFGIWFRGAAVVIAIVLFALFLIAFLVWVIPAFRQSLLSVSKNTWGDKWVFGRIASFHFVSSMSLALSSGLDIEDSAKMAASVAGDSKVLQAKYGKCVEMYSNGSKLTEALKETGVLSARDGRLLSLGDQSGNADEAMVEIARRNDRLVQDEIAAIVGRIEPTLVITTSVIVGVILLSVMLPLVGIMTTIG